VFTIRWKGPGMLACSTRQVIEWRWPLVGIRELDQAAAASVAEVLREADEARKGDAGHLALLAAVAFLAQLAHRSSQLTVSRGWRPAVRCRVPRADLGASDAC